ncbi:DUF2189 domain-containing protein [Chitinimonas taiwanensis]|uniref:Uncharacterized membrane protein n=1 Tax=Chitinimonas taiwanensis DSM 18899 TaxID=1121279 RepID=A0A1K2HPB5_9NEIS|nr:DUF2189 domain-containing protein [Chitinimonas taiwanensis]SFZ78652.1 Uncharacterized membrane protein [Chitinimonas taiwanensis DSM 18899]
MAEAIDDSIPAPLNPRVRDLPWYTPFSWLKLALGDIRATPSGLLFYGLAFVAMGWSIRGLFGYAPEHTMTLVTAFLLAGPFICLGLYEISRRHETLPRVQLLPTLTALRINVAGISLFAIILALLVAGWMRVSVVVFALFFTENLPDLKLILSPAFLAEADNLTFMIVWLSAGAFFSLLTFALSVVSIPIMLDRDADTLTAMFASVRVCLANPACMLTWGAIIVLLVVLGFALWGVGVAFTVPLVGHATWHAYRALIE